MREILFRGKPKTDYWFFSQIWGDSCKDGFVYGSLLVSKDKYYICVSAICAINQCVSNGTTSMIEVDPSTVGQYTCLNDRNGKRIFEGDVLQFGERRLMVWWNGEGFQWQAKSILGYDVIPYEISNRGDWTNIDLGNIYAEVPITGDMTTEIIGNIYDNPDLLK